VCTNTFEREDLS